MSQPVQITVHDFRVVDRLTHYLTNIVSRGNRKIEPGDKGIWASCIRGMERKATEELKSLFEECAEKFYNLGSGDSGGDGNKTDIDIEASIQMEIDSLKKSKKSPKLFQFVYLDLECVLFAKILDSFIDPVDFVDRICRSIEMNPESKKTRYVYRLTPVTRIARATEIGLEELCSQVLSASFQLNHAMFSDSTDPQDGRRNEKKINETSSYAIRPTIRNHSTLKRENIIKQIAASISDIHKVNLIHPEKVIIAEVYKAICGLSVVDGKQWERLKRYNLAELYSTCTHSSTRIKTNS